MLFCVWEDARILLIGIIPGICTLAIQGHCPVLSQDALFEFPRAHGWHGRSDRGLGSGWSPPSGPSGLGVQVASRLQQALFTDLAGSPLSFSGLTKHLLHMQWLKKQH